MQLTNYLRLIIFTMFDTEYLYKQKHSLNYYLYCVQCMPVLSFGSNFSSHFADRMDTEYENLVVSMHFL